MDANTLWLVIGGSLRDPLLWILAAVLGWDVDRELRRTIGFLASAGGVWGGIRGAVYIGLGETVSTTLIVTLIAICVTLTVFFGLAVREVRWLVQGR